jgi:hypothetical protein
MLINSSVFPGLSWTSFKVSGLMLGSLIHSELISIQGDRHGSSFSFPSNICWRHCLFSIVYFGRLCQESGEHSCVDSYLGPLFCSTGLHISFCASTILLLLLWLCIIVWSQVLWYLQHCSFCSVLPWLFVVFCASKWTLAFSKNTIKINGWKSC